MRGIVCFAAAASLTVSLGQPASAAEHGDATSAEILQLIDNIKSAARKERGIELETEVEIVGEP